MDLNHQSLNQDQYQPNTLITAKAPGPSLTPPEWAEYENFLSRYQVKLRRIAYRTQGEHDLGDVESEALFMALKLRDSHGVSIDFDNASFLDLLFSHLHQHLVRYTDTTIRYAVRLDHGTSKDEDAPHTLANLLVSDEGRDPLALLIAKEAALGTDAHAENHPSLAAAYVRLLEHFNNHVISVASHLLLSLSHTYKRISHARVLAAYQQPLTLPPPGDKFLPGPWRRFKLKRTPVQLTFDFEDELALGQ